TAAGQLETSPRGEVSEVVAKGLGIERDATGLHEVATFAATHRGEGSELAGMIAEAALARTESRGAHQRADFPAADPGQASRRAWVMPQSGGSKTTKLPTEHQVQTTTTAASAVAVGGSLAC